TPPPPARRRAPRKYVRRQRHRPAPGRVRRRPVPAVPRPARRCRPRRPAPARRRRAATPAPRPRSARRRTDRMRFAARTPPPQDTPRRATLERLAGRRYKAPMPRSHRPDRRALRFTARTADRHVLYQEAVQAPERDARFLSRYFQKTTGAPLRRFREDFCGTALLSCWFVKLHRDNAAIGIDRHWPTLAWGRIDHVRPRLDADQQRRLELRRADVRAVRRPAVQAIAALNFSYSVFQTRSGLRGYFANAFASLEPGGMLFVDAWGGPDVMEEKTDRTRNHGFDYLWEQRAYDPISHRIECAI